MLRQIEGSQAVAETVAMCRPEVVCAYPISPQTHIIEAVGAKVKTGELAPCEFINVESEFAAMSVSIGASAAGARAYTATASQGLLFMIEAVYNAAGLGLPVVMTLANRAIGAPINIWNDHSDAMAVRDAGWIQLFAETNQEAADLHVLAFRLAEELSVPVMVCMDGFILTHAVERVDLPDQEQVDRLSPPTSRARCSTPTTRSPSARWSAPRPSRRSATSRTCANARALERHPRDRRAQRRGPRARRRRAAARLPHRGRRRRGRGDGFGAGHDQGRRRRPCARRRARRRARYHRPSDRSRSTRSARPSRGPRPSSSSRRRSASASAACSRPTSPWRSRARRCRPHGRRRTGWTSGVGRVARSCSSTPTRAACAETLPRPRHRPRGGRARADGDQSPLGAAGGERAARPRRQVGTELMASERTPVRFYQVGQLRGRQPTAGARAAHRAQSDAERTNSIDSGHRACPGCGEALGARYALDAAMRATEGRLVAVNATGCLEVFSTPYPETSWRIAWLHSLFGNASGGGDRRRRRDAREGTQRRARRRPGAATAARSTSASVRLSGMFERNDDVLFICYDNEGYMNTGVQRSAHHAAARRAPRRPRSSDPSRATSSDRARTCRGSPWPTTIPYVATATVADLHDLESKVERAMALPRRALPARPRALPPRVGVGVE